MEEAEAETVAEATQRLLRVRLAKATTADKEIQIRRVTCTVAAAAARPQLDRVGIPAERRQTEVPVRRYLARCTQEEVGVETPLHLPPNHKAEAAGVEEADTPLCQTAQSVLMVLVVEVVAVETIRPALGDREAKAETEPW
jgi:hypothetical protein